MDTTPTKKGAIAFMAGNPVAANLIMFCCLFGGMFMFSKVKKEVFPEFALDTISISVSYPGASPEEVEQGVVLAVEEAVRGIEGVEEVTSVAGEGSGRVSLEIIDGSDIQKVSDDVRSAIDRITTFPDDTEEPRVSIDSRRREVLNVFVYGDVSQHVLRELGEQLRESLLLDKRITQVELNGLPDLEIQVAISQDNLRRYNLTMVDVAQRIAASSLDLPGGSIDASGGEILLRLTERRELGREFGELPIVTDTNGTPVLLKDIATITDGFADTDEYATWNGMPSVEVEVYRVGDQTPTDVAAAAREIIEEFQAGAPPTVGAAVVRDRSTIYQQRLDMLMKNGMIGLCLVLVILGFFLELRLAFWVMLGIPISFMGSFLLLPFLDVSFNMISMFAYLIALGIVVDDAIVVGENVYHQHQDGKPFSEAAVDGTRAVAMPVTFSILTNMVAFAPLYFIPGITGKIFGVVPIVVSLVFVMSWIESLFVLPAHLGHQRDRHRRGLSAWIHNRQQAFSHWFKHWIYDVYGPALKFVLRWRYVTVAAGFAILMTVLSYVISGRMGFDLFPKVESDYARASAVLQVGSPISRVEVLAERMLKAAEEISAEHPGLVEGVFTDLGNGGSHNLRMDVHLAGPEIRKNIMSTDEFSTLWRERVGEVVGVESLRFESDSGGPGRGRGLTVQLSHSDLATLRKASEELAEELTNYPMVKDTDDGFQPGKQQLDFTITDLGRKHGLTARDVARQLRGLYYGAEAIRQQRGRDEIKVMVRLPRNERISEQSVEDLMVRTPAGTYLPFNDVAKLDRGRAYMTIDRKDARRVVQVAADVQPRNKAGEVQLDLTDSVLPDLIAKYPGLQASFEGRQAEMRESTGTLKITFLLAMIVVYALLAIPFRSYLQPMIIMVAIPFGVVGAILGHLVMGYGLSIISILGMVALAGVVINDSLVLIDFTNQQRSEGKTSFDAVQVAACQRFRAILLTTLTTFGGLAPMIFESSRQARFLIPMAISLGYGILFGTVITLLLIPCLYLVMEDIRTAVTRTWRWFFGASTVIPEHAEKA